MPEAMIVFIAFVDYFFDDVHEWIGFIPLVVGGVGVPWICLRLSWRAMCEIDASQGTRKGLPIVYTTMIVSIIHLLIAAFYICAILHFAIVGK